MPTPEEFAEDFVRRFGTRPTIFRAPGRVNLIGEHTDYNEGFILPAALEYETWVAAAPRSDRKLAVHSRARNETRTFDLDAAAPKPLNDWTDYVYGTALVLERAGHRLSGADLMITSSVPIGSGLSSSAALEVSVGYSLLSITGVAVDTLALALICQKAENEYVGMRCGIMDQYISCRGVADHALLIDCRTLESRQVPIDPSVRIVVSNSMVHHQLSGGANEYNARRAACEEGVRLLQPALPGITALRDVTPAALEAHKGLVSDLVYRRCRHIVTENARVLAAEAALTAGDVVRFGTLMDQSHLSMRDDYEISCAEVDILVDLARELPGVYGSRMTGGGFGGCTVSLVAADAVGDFIPALRDAYANATGLVSTIFACSPGAGVGALSL
ncbi:MAG: galactokinase [Ancalomicrobiaceae bacterium]|nr:galactokinase [Ancalomicrobiaceae bacterium]